MAFIMPFLLAFEMWDIFVSHPWSVGMLMILMMTEHGRNSSHITGCWVPYGCLQIWKVHLSPLIITNFEMMKVVDIWWILLLQKFFSNQKHYFQLLKMLDFVYMISLLRAYISNAHPCALCMCAFIENIVR